MERESNFIGLDAHSRTCDLGWMTPSGRRREVWKVRTTIPELTEAIERVPRPRKLAMEEGPMADWLLRQLRPFVDELVVCDPRRNALIGRDGDKTDALDALALANLYRGGYLRAVHHPESMDREVFKRHVALYHDRVEHRVGEANKVLALLRRYGVVVKDADLADAERRAAVIAGLPEDPTVRLDVDLLLSGYDSATSQVRRARVVLVKLAKKDEVVKRWTGVPGVRWVRAATLRAYLDTPDRFRNKSALWKYLGIGLQKRVSGKGPEVLRPPTRFNRHLKNAILGAAMTAIRARDNPFADQYKKLVERGVAPRIARRTVARTMAAVMWGMWKHGGEYQPGRVGVPDGKEGARDADRPRPRPK